MHGGPVYSVPKADLPPWNRVARSYAHGDSAAPPTAPWPGSGPAGAAQPQSPASTACAGEECSELSQPSAEAAASDPGSEQQEWSCASYGWAAQHGDANLQLSSSSPEPDKAQT